MKSGFPKTCNRNLYFLEYSNGEQIRCIVILPEDTTSD